MSDKVFAILLDGIFNQCVWENDSDKIKIQYVQSIMYSNNSIGKLSMNKLIKLIPNLIELVLNNVQFITFK